MLMEEITQATLDVHIAAYDGKSKNETEIPTELGIGYGRIQVARRKLKRKLKQLQAKMEEA